MVVDNMRLSNQAQTMRCWITQPFFIPDIGHTLYMRREKPYWISNVCVSFFTLSLFVAPLHDYICRDEQNMINKYTKINIIRSKRSSSFRMFFFLSFFSILFLSISFMYSAKKLKECCARKFCAIRWQFTKGLYLEINEHTRCVLFSLF